jgi:hypothetical protein
MNQYRIITPRCMCRLKAGQEGGHVGRIANSSSVSRQRDACAIPLRRAYEVLLTERPQNDLRLDSSLKQLHTLSDAEEKSFGGISRLQVQACEKK